MDQAAGDADEIDVVNVVIRSEYSDSDDDSANYNNFSVDIKTEESDDSSQNEGSAMIKTRFNGFDGENYVLTTCEDEDSNSFEDSGEVNLQNVSESERKSDYNSLRKALHARVLTQQEDDDLSDIGIQVGPNDTRDCNNAILVFIYSTINEPYRNVSPHLTSRFNLSAAQLDYIRKLRRQIKNRMYARNCRLRRVNQMRSLAEEVSFIRIRKQAIQRERKKLEAKKIELQLKCDQIYIHVMRELTSKWKNWKCPIESNISLSEQREKSCIERETLETRKEMMESKYEQLYSHVFKVLAVEYSDYGTLVAERSSGPDSLCSNESNLSEDNFEGMDNCDFEMRDNGSLQLYDNEEDSNTDEEEDDYDYDDDDSNDSESIDDPRAVLRTVIQDGKNRSKGIEYIRDDLKTRPQTAIVYGIGPVDYSNARFQSVIKEGNNVVSNDIGRAIGDLKDGFQTVIKGSKSYFNGIESVGRTQTLVEGEQSDTVIAENDKKSRWRKLDEERKRLELEKRNIENKYARLFKCIFQTVDANNGNKLLQMYTAYCLQLLNLPSHDSVLNTIVFK